MSAELEFEKIIEHIASTHAGVAGQMFGKRCIKINSKAGIALFNECLVFKLPKEAHAEAMDLTGSILWDPSGKGRAMKEWVQITLDHKKRFKEFAKASADYVG